MCIHIERMDNSPVRLVKKQVVIIRLGDKGWISYYKKENVGLLEYV
jgi:hypothetical protein